MTKNNNPLVKVADIGARSRPVVFENPQRSNFDIVKIDGCCVKNERAADFLVRADEKNLILELKGRDFEHGIKQVLATAQLCIERDYASRPIHGAVVATRAPPAANTSLQRAQDRLRRDFGGKFSVYKGDTPIPFQRLAPS